MLSQGAPPPVSEQFALRINRLLENISPTIRNGAKTKPASETNLNIAHGALLVSHDFNLSHSLIDARVD
jgi:hypothetical protein